MLSFTKKTEYALIAVCHLAHAGQTVVSARNIARQYRVRLSLLMNVLKSLNQKGLLRSVRGARGGYALAVDPREVSRKRLIEAVEGPPRLTKCAAPMAEAKAACELMETCPVRLPLAKVHGHFGQLLGSVTIADVAFDKTYRGHKATEYLKALAQ